MHRQRLVPALVSASLFALLLFTAQSVDAQTSVSGYIQAEWQHFDQSSNPDGRAFYWDARKNFFTIRRGRAKFTHQDSNYMAVLQSDFTERGVELKDAYLTVNLLDDDLLNATVGLFNRPNFEVERSSSTRESPERSQVIRAFYPGERDLGFMLESTPEIAEDFSPTFQLAVLNGTQRETDALKDLAARLIVPLPLGNDSKVKVTVGGTYYTGGIPQPDDTVLKFEGGELVSVYEDGSGSWAGFGNRSHVGVEAQITASLFSFGKTALYTEFLTGSRPEATVRAPVDSLPEVNVPTVLIRNQAGYYIMLTQELSRKFMVAGKYDVFDRNTDLSGTEVNSIFDRSSSVIGFGVLGTFGPVRVAAWYEIPAYATDEARYTDVGGAAGSDDLKDNKMTVRFQYRFR